MGKYLDILERAAAERVGETRRRDVSDISDKSPPFGRLSRFGRTLTTLESRCPDLVPAERWQQAVADGQRFLARWDKQAHALGWTAKDLFSLYPMSAHAKPSFNRLARYDEIGLIWLLDGREVVVLTDATAAIKNAIGNVTIYRRHNKPELGPVGDSLDDSPLRATTRRQ
jgi:hypothetical protein